MLVSLPLCVKETRPLGEVEIARMWNDRA